MSKFSSKDIQKQYREEVRRKTPIDEDKLREAAELQRVNREWLAAAAWEDIEVKISAAGLLPGSPEYEEIRSLWKSVQQDIHQKRKQPF
ncbi:MAG: hypothetical protein L0Z46_10885 [Nitrospiraceae bacterium]|nr:hypothetical protein [Nitrospiraceae bacterium]